MAGDWIKMRVSLSTSPKVVRIASALKADRLRTVGGLHSAWCLFDAHSDDGVMRGYSPDVLDELIGWPGFTQAMIDVEWASFDGQNLSLPRFDEHNGASAKRRAMDADRKRASRMSASEADKRPQNVSLREEKRREEIKQEQDQKPSVRQVARSGEGRFPEWWAEYPKKVARKPALAKWKARNLDGIADQLIDDVRNRMANDDGWKRGYIPDPTTYLSQDRWNDDLRRPPRPPATTPAPSKTRALIDRLEYMKHGLARNGTTAGATEAPVLRLGQDPRD